MSRFDPFYDFRGSLAKAVIRDTVGPAGSEDELIDDSPIVRYISGVLYPMDSGTLDPAQDIDVPDDDEGANTDSPVALAHVRYPSSIGMTFAVDTKIATQLQIEIKVARYESVGTGRASAGPWKRVPIAIAPLTLDLNTPPDMYQSVAEKLDLFCRVRQTDADGVAAVTLALLNRKRTSTQGMRDPDTFFQPEIRVLSVDEALTERRSIRDAGTDEELKSFRLLYRHAREFAVGHGCAVRWELDEQLERCSEVVTTFAPQHELLLADSNPTISLQALGMQFLTRGLRADVMGDLEQLCVGYEAWITDREAEIPALRTDLRTVATANLAQCREASLRMRGGIEVLRKDDLAWEAFRLANAAMLSQRARTVWLRKGKTDPQPIEGTEHQWRPFQLAFMLLCLKGIARPLPNDPEFGDGTPDRETADLLWFPTGGGKTEAYLGLIAFTVFLRRLRAYRDGKDGGGVTALMRYTLRLLTIQQFERATLLICCCETIRRTRTDMGREPISIGLWVGQSATPNKLSDARTAIDELRAGRTVERKNPVQIRSCPWCGTPMDARNYWIATDRKRMVISCQTDGCEYKNELPVYLVDEDVYTYRPTLMIATVDKFAALPWDEKTVSLFGSAFGTVREQLAPELIIQDELHLISGPLGTLTGLYETAVDLLCSRNGIRPKIVASTATIRRAESQTRSLFDRSVRQFPPPALDARDSYFAVETPRDRKGTRLYVGLMAPGTSHTTLLVRTYAALLQFAQDLPASDEVKDPYLTLTGYFNSLRVLGGARMQVQDDVEYRMALLASQSKTTSRNIEMRIELTSREGADKIPGHLKQMALSFPDPSALSVILATNMISVGVDVDRLGLMTVMGQPQSTSEYIQATSRVGRQHPGLVFILYNSGRSRDRSHYESFTAYHSALYRQVESTSVTPFSARARDRGLHAVLIALARHYEPGLRANASAENIAKFRTQIEALATMIVDRVVKLAPDEAAATKTQLNEILSKWEALAADGGNLVFQNPVDVVKTLLVEASIVGPIAEERFPTLRSLRDVDSESQLYLVS